MSSAESEQKQSEPIDSDESVEAIVDEVMPEETDSQETAEVETVELPVEEVEKWKDAAARAQADLENFRKRMARERADAIAYANRNLLEELFPIIDNFEMGLRAAKESDGESSMIYQGMAMVRKQLEDFLWAVGRFCKPFDSHNRSSLRYKSCTVGAGGVYISKLDCW